MIVHNSHCKLQKKGPGHSVGEIKKKCRVTLGKAPAPCFSEKKVTRVSRMRQDEANFVGLIRATLAIVLLLGLFSFNFVINANHICNVLD